MQPTLIFRCDTVVYVSNDFHFQLLDVIIKFHSPIKYGFWPQKLNHFVSFWLQKFFWPILTISEARNWSFLSISGARNWPIFTISGSSIEMLWMEFMCTQVRKNLQNCVKAVIPIVWSNWVNYCMIDLSILFNALTLYCRKYKLLNGASFKLLVLDDCICSLTILTCRL